MVNPKDKLTPRVWSEDDRIVVIKAGFFLEGTKPLPGSSSNVSLGLLAMLAPVDPDPTLITSTPFSSLNLRFFLLVVCMVVH